MIHGIIDDQRKTLSELRKKLRSAGFANAETSSLSAAHSGCDFWYNIDNSTATPLNDAPLGGLLIVVFVLLEIFLLSFLTPAARR